MNTVLKPEYYHYRPPNRIPTMDIREAYAYNNFGILDTVENTIAMRLAERRMRTGRYE